MANTTRNFVRKLLLAKIETTSGTDAVPVPASNAIEARNVQFTPLDAAFVENAVEYSFFGSSVELPVSAAARLQFDVAIQGGGTAGLTQPFGALLRGCGMAELLLASALSGSAQAGGTNTITLAAAGSSAVDNAYIGMPLSITSGAGAGQSGIILAYNGTTKVATMMDAWTTPPAASSGYTIAANASYRPVSSAFESLTNYLYIDGLLHKLLYSRGSVKLKLSPKSVPMFSFDFLSMYSVPTDTTMPSGAVLSGFKQPNPVTNSWTSGAVVGGFQTNLYDFGLDLGQKVIHRDDVVGVDDVLITDRAPSGSIEVQGGLVAEKDWFTLAKNATLGSVAITHGTAAGSRFRLALPSTQLKSPKIADKNGVVTYGMDLRPVPVNGNDEAFFIFD